MVFKKYKVADNAMAKLALPLTETTKTISIKDAINIPDGWERIATLVKVAGNEVIKMEKVIVKSRTENVLQVERGFESNPLQRETNDLLCLNVTAEVIRDLQNAVAEIDVNNKESLSNKKAKIVWNQTSNLFYPTVKAVWDWVTGLLNKKADLVNGKVPASQLPEVSQIDESNIVHKSWDEEIGGKKSFNEGVYFDRSFGLNTLDANGNKTKLYWNSLRAPNNHHHILPDLVNQDGGVSSIYIGYNGQQNEIGLSVKWKTNYLLIKDDLNMYVNDQNRTGERKDYTPTVTAWQGSPTLNYSSGRYKQIGKIVHCYARAEVKRNNWWGRFWISLPILAKDYGEIICGISLVGWIGTRQESSYWYITAGWATAQILSWIWSAAHMGNLPETFQIHINLTYESQ